MHQEESPQESELGNGKISRPRSLHALIPTDANTNVSGLNHGDVICTVSNGQACSLEIVLDHQRDLCLLQWTHTTTYETGASGGNLKEGVLKGFIHHDLFQ